MSDMAFFDVNWSSNEVGSVFYFFNKEITRSWIQEGFKKEDAEEWLKAGVSFNKSSYAYYLLKEKEKNSIDYKNLSKEIKVGFIKDYNEWIKGFFYCHLCNYREEKEKVFEFSHLNEKFNFCSSDCKEEWSLKNLAEKWILEKIDERGFFIFERINDHISKITHLSINYKNLIGFLDLTNFVNLKVARLDFNKLWKVVFPINKLKKISLNNNSLVELDFNSFNKTIVALDIRNNNLNIDLSSLKDFPNLKILIVGNNLSNKGNNFSGKLEKNIETDIMIEENGLTNYSFRVPYDLLRKFESIEIL